MPTPLSVGRGPSFCSAYVFGIAFTLTLAPTFVPHNMKIKQIQ